MNTRSRWLAVGVVALALWAPTVVAQATRTWVSGVGDDANPCSRTAPCKTFAGAISKTAPAGEINALDPGAFGAVTIAHSITIDGGGGQIAGVLVSSVTNGIVIRADATDKVILRNLDITGLDTGLSGIDVRQAGRVFIENVKVSGFTVAGINVSPTASAVGDTVNVAIERSRLIQNATGLLVAPTGTGVAAVRLSDSDVLQNATGLSATGTGKIISFNTNRLNGNTTDGAPTSALYQR